MELSPDGIRSVLKTVKYPGFTRDIVSFGIVKNIKVEGGSVEISLVLPKPDSKLESEITESVRNRILETPGVGDVSIRIAAREPKPAPGQEPARAEARSKLPRVKYYIAVASGKGGVGKSTVAVNLAVAIAKKRKNVGLMDADIWGPSLPIMLGVTDRPHATDENKIIPLEKHGLSSCP